MSSMNGRDIPSRTSRGVASRIIEIGRPFQTFSALAFAWRSSRVRTWTYWSHSGTRKARWLSGYGGMWGRRGRRGGRCWGGGARECGGGGGGGAAGGGGGGGGCA